MTLVDYRCPRCDQKVVALPSSTVMHECPAHPKQLLTTFVEADQ